MKSKILSILLLLPVLLIGAVLIVPSFMDWNKYKPEIIKQVKEKAGFDLALNGDISLSVLPMPSVKLEQVVVENKESKLATLDAVSVSLQLLPLLSKEIRVDDVALVKPNINIEIDAQGNGNWQNDVMASSAAKDTPESKAEGKDKSAGSALKGFSIDDFSIEEGTLSFKNAQTNASHLVENIDLEAEIEDMKGPFSGDVSLKYQGKTYDVSGEVKSISDMNKIPLDVSLILDKGDIIASFNGQVNATEQSALGGFSVKGKDLSKYAGDKAEGAFDASGVVEYTKSNIKLDDFKASLAGLKFEGSISNKTEMITLNIKETTKSAGQGLIGAVLSNAKVNAAIEMKDKSINIPKYDLVLRGSSLSGAGAYKFEDGIELSLNADSLDVDEWLKLAGKETKAGKSGGAGTSSGANAKPQGFSIPMAAKVNANIGALKYQGKNYKNVKLDVSTAKDSVSINNVSLNMDHGTEIAVKGKVANTQKLSGLDIKGSMKTSDADALLKSLNVSRDAYKERIGALTVDGAINGSLDVAAFSTKLHNQGLTLNVSGKVEDAMGARNLNGLNLRLQHANFVNAVKMAQPSFSMDRAWQKPLDLSVGLNMAGDTITISSMEGKVGLIPVESASLAIKTGGSTPSVSGKLALGNLEFPSANGNAPSNNKATGRGASASSSSGKWSTAPIDTSWMKTVTADLDITAKSFTQNKWVFKNPSLDFSLKGGALTISTLKADMFNGKALLSGEAVSGQDGKGFSNVKLTADIENVNAQTLYSAVKGKDTNMITGFISKASENVSTRGTSMASLISNLNGIATVKGQRLIINGVDITNFVRAMNGDIKGLNSFSDISGALYKGKTEFDTLDAKFDIKNGIVNFNPVKLDGAKATFDVTGTLDLPKWWIDINNRATIKTSGDEIPPFDMSFRGSLDNPVKSAGGDALKNLVQRKLQKLINDKGIADKLNNKLGIDLFGGQQQQKNSAPATGTPSTGTEEQPAQQKQQKPEDVLKDALGGFLGGL